MKIGVFFNTQKENAAAGAVETARTFENQGFEVLMCNEDQESELVIKNCDIAAIVGGDGTILRYARLAAQFKKPILGVKNGLVGFLAELEKGRLENVSKLILDYKIIKRMMLEVLFEIDGELKSFYALNDVVISRSCESQIIHYKIFKSRESIDNYGADGVIIATPTGSTAYSLSAGGPIVESTMQCVVITPMCAYSLAARPKILTADEEIIIECNLKPGSEVLVTVDGEVKIKSQNSKLVKIKKADLTADFIRFD